MMPRARILVLSAAALAALSAVSIAQAAPSSTVSFRRTVLDPQGSYGEP